MPPRHEPLPEDVAAWTCARLGLGELPPTGPVVPRAELLAFARALKVEHDFWYFVYCVATHYPAVGEPGAEGYAPDRTRLDYRVRRLPNRRLNRPAQSFPFRVWVPTGETSPSLASVWVGADWQEREQFDLVGTVFEGHPDLRRLMMPEDWPGHPLRRDYAIETGHFPWR